MTPQQTALIADALRPGDDGYDTAARTFYTTGYPALVVRPRGPDEVAALTHAERHDLAVSVRSGGHSPLGHSTNTGGIVIDLAHLDDIEVLDTTRRLVRVGGGATWGQVAAALDPHGWALTAGDTTNVGVGGLTLGGGIGWMVRRHGLAIDNLVGARVVTADGRLLTTSAEEHPDLFWALRGGGGNFGVVVDFDFLAQPVSTVHFGTVAYRLDDPADLLARWRDVMRVAPEELSSTLALPPRIPGAPPSATVLLCYAGESGTTGVRVRRRARTAARVGHGDRGEHLRAPVLRDPRRRRAPAAPAAGHPQHPGSDARRRCDRGNQPAPRHYHGPHSRRGAQPGRSLRSGAAGRDSLRPPPRRGDDRRSADAPRHGNRPADRAGARATASDLAAAYTPAAYTRLAAVKRAYDPGNRFALNHNIEPARLSDPRQAA